MLGVARQFLIGNVMYTSGELQVPVRHEIPIFSVIGREFGLIV